MTNFVIAAFILAVSACYYTSGILCFFFSAIFYLFFYIFYVLRPAIVTDDGERLSSLSAPLWISLVSFPKRAMSLDVVDGVLLHGCSLSLAVPRSRNTREYV